MAGCNDLVLARPDETGKGQEAGGNVEHGARRLVGGAGIDNSDGGIVRAKGEGVARGRKGDVVNPAGRGVQELAADGVEGQTLAPGGGRRPLVDTLDVAGEHAGVGVGGAGGKKDGVGVPGQRCDGGADGLLEVLADPPVVFLFKIADGDDAGAGADGELCFGGGPADKGGGAVDTEEDEGGTPAGGGVFPDVGIAIWKGWWVGWFD